MADYELIETRADLDALAQDLLSEKVLSVDTEADSFYHYFDKTCLVQIATRRQIFLVGPPGDRRSIGAVAPGPGLRLAGPSARSFTRPSTTSSCSSATAPSSSPTSSTTMISAQLLGYPAVGLAGIAERHCDVKLPKDEQRSDWSRRPLTAKQLSYAAADVLYLIQLAETLTKELRKAKRLHWAEEEFETLTLRRGPKREFDELGYLRIKGARKLDARALSVLRELYLMPRRPGAGHGPPALQGDREPHPARARGAAAHEDQRPRPHQGHHGPCSCDASAATSSRPSRRARPRSTGPSPSSPAAGVAAWIAPATAGSRRSRSGGPGAPPSSPWTRACSAPTRRWRPSPGPTPAVAKTWGAFPSSRAGS